LPDRASKTASREAILQSRLTQFCRCGSAPEALMLAPVDVVGKRPSRWT
jgi:hypothetical protein